MLKSSERLLQILSLLQTRSFWPGPALADRLEVSTRTIRTDVERLRSLGYPIHSTPGVAGGYQLGAGAALPPLLLDDEEAVAVVIGLTAASGEAVTGVEEASVRALAKLHQVLPSQLRHRVTTMQAAVVAVPSHGPPIDTKVLLTIAAACRDLVQLRFDYRTNADSRRVVEPYRLVIRQGRWYLFAFDLERDDWRTFRVDRMTPGPTTGRRFAPRELPPEGAADHLDRGVAAAPWGFRARVRIHAAADEVARRLPPSAGAVIPVDADTCVLETGSDDPTSLLRYLTMLDLDFSVADNPALATAARRLAQRLGRAAAEPTE